MQKKTKTNIYTKYKKINKYTTIHNRIYNKYKNTKYTKRFFFAFLFLQKIQKMHNKQISVYKYIKIYIIPKLHKNKKIQNNYMFIKNKNTNIRIKLK